MTLTSMVDAIQVPHVIGAFIAFLLGYLVVHVWLNRKARGNTATQVCLHNGNLAVNGITIMNVTNTDVVFIENKEVFLNGKKVA